MNKEKLAIEIQNSLKDTLKNTKWSVCDFSNMKDVNGEPLGFTPVVYDPLDLKPIVTIMENTESGERLRFTIKVSDESEEIEK